MHLTPSRRLRALPLAVLAATLSLLAACGGSELGAPPDAGADARRGVDGAARDTGPRPDAAAIPDALHDAPTDAPNDAPNDAPHDARHDAVRDALVALDGPQDGAQSEPTDTVHDALRDAAQDAPDAADARQDAAAGDAYPAPDAPDAVADGGSAPPQLRVMTFNIRFDAGGLGSALDPNGWENLVAPRRARVVAVISAADPDLFGVQEALSNQLADLEAALPAYDWYGVGRDDGAAAGEFSALFWRAERFAILDSGTFWLSETPEQPGTSFPGALPRLASWVVLEDRAAGRTLFWLNTHWDHASESARLRSAYLIRDRLEPLSGGRPVVLTGDFNTGPDTVPLVELRSELEPPDRPLRDGYRRVYPVASPDEATFHGWLGTTAGVRIDFVLHTDDFTPVAAQIDRTEFDGVWPSDHYPVLVDLRW